MSEPRTAAGRRLLTFLQSRSTHGNYRNTAEPEDIAAIEAEAAELAWSEIGTRFVSHIDEANRRSEAVGAYRVALTEAVALIDEINGCHGCLDNGETEGRVAVARLRALIEGEQ